MKSIIVIPARMQSSRLPGKPLIDINGQTLLQRTYNQCLKAFPRECIYVATDDVKIEKDIEREKFLKYNGIRTARFTNEQVLSQTQEVLSNLRRIINKT